MKTKKIIHKHIIKIHRIYPAQYAALTFSFKHICEKCKIDYAIWGDDGETLCVLVYLDYVEEEIILDAMVGSGLFAAILY